MTTINTTAIVILVVILVILVSFILIRYILKQSAKHKYYKILLDGKRINNIYVSITSTTPDNTYLNTFEVIYNLMLNCDINGLTQFLDIEANVRNIINHHFKNKRITLLHYAATLNYDEIVELICNVNSVDINARDINGKTPLHYAAEYLKESVERLVNHHAIVDVIDNDGKTPLHYATSTEEIEIVKYLVEKCRAKVNIADNDGKTPLHYAVEMDNYDMVECLINNGADISVRDINGCKPIHYAQNNSKTYDYLQRTKLQIQRRRAMKEHEIVPANNNNQVNNNQPITQANVNMKPADLTKMFYDPAKANTKQVYRKRI